MFNRFLFLGALIFTEFNVSIAQIVSLKLIEKKDLGAGRFSLDT